MSLGAWHKEVLSTRLLNDLTEFSLLFSAGVVVEVLEGLFRPLLRCLPSRWGASSRGKWVTLPVSLWENEGGKGGFLSGVGKRVSAGHPCLQAPWPGVSILLCLRAPNPQWQQGKLPGGHCLGSPRSLQARRSWEQARTSLGRCDLLSEAKGEPRWEEEGQHQQEAAGGSEEATRELGEYWAQLRGSRRGDHSWRRAWLDLSSFFSSLAAFSRKQRARRCPARRRRALEVLHRVSADLLVAPAPLGQNQAHWNHHRPWHLLSVPVSQAGFRFQKYVARLLSIEFRTMASH